MRIRGDMGKVFKGKIQRANLPSSQKVSESLDHLKGLKNLKPKETAWDLTLLSDSVDIVHKGEKESKILKAKKMLAETAYVLAEASKSAHLEKLSKVSSELIEGVNIAAGPYLVGVGVNEFKRAKSVWEKLHAVRNLAMGGSGTLMGLKGLASLIGSSSAKAALSALSPVISALGAVHGVIEVALGARELKHAVEENEKLKIADSLASIALGGLVTAAAVTHSPVIGAGLLAALGVKLGIFAYEALNKSEK